MSPEQRAVLLLLSLAVAGHGARAALGAGEVAPGALQVLGARDAAAALARRDSVARLGRPLAEGERLDVESASAAELARLPGIGPALARRIVADRERAGPFGDLAGLDRVAGVGPGLLTRLAPHLAFAGRPAAPPDTGRRRVGRRGVVQGEAPAEARGTPPLRHAAPPGILSQPAWAGRPEASVADILNAGTVAALDRLPGIGPARARRIVVYRDSAGPFRSAADLARVPGISLALATRVWQGGGGP